MGTRSKSSKALLWTIAALVLVLLILKAFVVGVYRLPQNGMYPTLPAGRLFFTSKHPYRASADVRRGDIIVFVRDIDGQPYNYVWRVVALPGQRVVMSGDALT